MSKLTSPTFQITPVDHKLQNDNFLKYNHKEFSDYMKYLKDDKFYDTNFLKRIKQNAIKSQ